MAATVFSMAARPFCISMPGGNIVAFSVYIAASAAASPRFAAAAQAASLASIWAFRSGTGGGDGWAHPNSSNSVAASVTLLVAISPSF